MINKSWRLAVIAFCMASCSKEFVPQPQLQLPPDPIGFPVSVTIDQAQAGQPLPATFEGLSFETKILTSNRDFLNADNKVLVQLIKNLGPGILRIGGSTSDEVFWTENSDSQVAHGDSLTKADIDRLSAFSKATGWRVLFGLNLGTYNTDAAASEALYVSASLGNNLYAFQSGNEPDFYAHGPRGHSYNYTAYQAEWESYLASVLLKTPNSVFAGPDVANNTDWITAFAETESNNTTLLDGHYYADGPASDPAITYRDILTNSTKLDEYLQTIHNVSAKHHLIYRISECNNIYGGGKAGTSDVFASALWALDAMWKMAGNNAAGVNFHDGIGLSYSPIVVQNGSAAAAPEYYAMLAFAFAGAGGTMIPASVTNAGLGGVYACVRADHSLAVTLINKDSKDYSFRLQLGSTASSVHIYRLIAPSIISASGVTFAGSSVNADGGFSAKTIEQYTINSNYLNVNLPAGSAAVVILR